MNLRYAKRIGCATADPVPIPALEPIEPIRLDRSILKVNNSAGGVAWERKSIRSTKRAKRERDGVAH
jgi:hypothetical protein